MCRTILVRFGTALSQYCAMNLHYGRFSTVMVVLRVGEWAKIKSANGFLLWLSILFIVDLLFRGMFPSLSNDTTTNPGNRR